ncbi:E3 ubiquitin-protein ligase HUWE1-like isoform X3 [Actinia tenebrosa]|uniref:HECT-type E3 ubiquitin transferase n=1 Tax=Actinia tenebrosa TaxID=6105 RepID=A0A6P8J296_ACTTE|nr:E3 ubiquitin-protein ligase HUWE1-like isoform X3 [Actinia tenebrosa]
MKIDRSKIRKSHSQPAPECQQLIQRLTNAKDGDIVDILKSVDTWFYGKCDLGHWADVLDRFDDILASVSKQVNGSAWILTYDKLDILEGPEVAAEKRELVNQVLRFTALLIEHAYSRPAYNSAEHLIALLGASDMEVVLSVLGLLYVFSKRCSFIPRLPADKRKPLQQRLLHIGENWGGKSGGFSLAECCKDKPTNEFPESAGDVHFEFYTQGEDNQTDENDQEKESQVCCIHVEKLYQFSENPGEIMEQLMAYYKVPEDKQVGLFSRVRLARHFPFYQERLRCVQARLWAISVLVYSNVSQDIQKSLMYQGFEEEVVELLELEDPKLLDIKTAGIRLLTSVIHLQFNPRLNTIVECAGMASYHGFLPTLMRDCIQTLVDPNKTSYPMSFSTALFSFVYHFACFEVGNEALVSSGLVESLLRVIDYPGDDEHLTFVTRSVRIMDWIGNTDTSGYQSGLTAVINRLEHEVKICMPYHGGILSPDLPQSDQDKKATSEQDNTATMDTNESSPPPQDSNATVPMETEQAGPSGIESDGSKMEVEETATLQANPTALQVSQHRCLPQRAALIKALLSFLKKAIPDPAFSETIRTVMDGSLPTSLKYIISNVEYYGPVLFLGAIDTVTVYVFHEPSLLSSLQDNGLTGVVMKSLVLKDIPAMREVLSSLPSVLSALCLNNRGLQAFMACQPFDKLFKVMLSLEYLPAMRRKKATEELGETASNLGIAMDELMRHQPTLKSDAMKAVVKLLQQVCELGQDPKSIGYKISDATKDGDVQENSTQGSAPILPSQASEEPMTDDEFDDDDRFSFTSTSGSAKPSPDIENNKELAKGSEEEKRTFIPLTDYILNVVKFVDAILSNNSTDDHCREFVRHQGLVPLVGILGLPNLPLDFPSSPSCQAVCSVSKSLLMLAHEPQVLKQGLLLLKQSLDKLKSNIYNPSENTDLSICHEVVSAAKPDKAMHSPQQTPLLHAITAVHACITMFLYVCRSGQVRKMDIRTMCINQWGSELGQSLLSQLGELYMSLLWETTVLETVEKEEVDLMNEGKESTEETSTGNLSSESAKDKEPSEKTSKGDIEQKSPLMPSQRRIVKQLLQVTSSVNKSLSEFFSSLLKLSVGTTQKQRRPPHGISTPSAPSLSAKVVTSQLCKVLKNALSWKGAAADKSSPGLRLHFYVNTINFASRLLFDDKKFPYHLMLQQFMMSGALNSLFEKFNWVLSQGGKIPLDAAADHPDMPDGTEEMIDAWLVFVEKLVNTKAILESPHSLPASSNAEGFVPFKPIQFLIKTHKRAFSAVGHLWGHKPFKVHGSHIAETMLAILCHVVQGESIINEKYGTDKSATSKGGATSVEPSSASSVLGGRATTPPQPEVDDQNVQQLVDMGFTRAQARHALMSTNSLEQATEFILNHPYPMPVDPIGDISQVHDFGLDYDMSEEDQMMRAIALSLGQDVSPMAVDQPASSSSATKKTEESETACKDEAPLSNVLLDNFTQKIFPSCRQLLEELPDTVYKACKLLAAVAKRNGSEWRDKVLAEVMDQVGKDTVAVIKNCSPESNKDKNLEEFVPQMCTMTEAARLSSLLHLSCLMFEEMKVSCAVLLDQYGIVNSLMELLDLCQASLLQLGRTVPEPTTPKWLCPLFLLLDLYEKTALSSERKKIHDKCTTRTWRWFDDRSGRWYAYSATNNEAIDAAYRNGETRIRFMAGRRPYNVNFSTMLQINEDTGSRRPIMLGSTYESTAITCNHRPNQPSNGSSTGNGETTQRQKSLGKTPKKAEEKPGKSKESEKEVADERIVQRLNESQKTAIIRCCAVLISIPVNNNALHAALRLCLRITQEHKYAVQFVNQGGHKAIISLTQKSSFPGFTSITTLLLHHVLEDSPNLQHTIEKVIRSVAVNGVSNAATGVSFNSVGAKEINYVLRLLGPAASRNPELFKEAVLKAMQYTITPQLRRVLVEGADVFLPSNHPQLVKVSPGYKLQKPPLLCDSVREVVRDLLNALCAPSDAASRAGGRMGSICVRRSDSQMLGEFGRALGQIGDMIDRFSTNNREETLSPGHPSYGRQITSEDTVVDSEEANIDSQPDGQEPSTSQAEKPKEKTKDVSKEKESKENKEKEAASKPLLTKSAILRILAELVKTYGGVAQLITEYTYSPPSLPGEKQYEGPVLAYIFDHLLISHQSNTSNDSPAFARLLLAVIATCSQAPEAQHILVTELKASLERALALPESPGKHHRLQALFGLIQTMIDSGSRQPQQALVQPPNNTMKLLTKRGLITDLARVTHSLDLGSPYLVTTLNALLKPLEKLSSIVNQPTGGPSTAQPKAGTQSTGVGTRDGASTTQEGATDAATQENQGTTTDSAEQSQASQVQTQDADVQATPELSEPEDTQASGGELEGEESVAAWDMGVSGHAVVVPSSSAEDDIDHQDIQNIVDELLQRGPERQNSQDPEMNVVSEEIVTQLHVMDDGGDDDEEDDTDVDDDSGSSSTDEQSDGNHSDNGGEDTMVITIERAGDQGEESNDRSHLDDQHDDVDDEEGVIVTGADNGDENVIVMGEVDDGDEDIEDEDDDDDDDDGEDDDEGSDMEEEHHPDMMEDDSFAVYEDDDMFLHIRDIQDDESDAGVVLGLAGQRHRGLPIRHHNGGTDIFHITTGGHETRLLVGDDGQMREITDEDGIFVDGYNESTNSIPSALSRWSEESQILDPESVHYCVAALKPEVFPAFEKRLSVDVEKEKVEEAKKKKEAEAKTAAKKKEDEEAAKKKAESEAAAAATAAAANQQTSEDMQVDQSSTPQPTPVAADDGSNTSLLVSMSMDHGSDSEPAVHTSTPRESEPAPSSATVDVTEPASNAQSSAPLDGQVSRLTPPVASSSGVGTDGQPEGATGEAGASSSVGSPMTLGSDVSVTSDSGAQGQANEDASQAAGVNKETTDSSQPQAQPEPSTSGENTNLTIDGVPIPEGVDPSFLEALPESLRREVLSEQLGLRPPPPSQPSDNASGEASMSSVSPEFLAALPPDVQEEVLQQQRLEQERRRTATAPPDQPVDPGAFLRNLPPSLRQTVLADIDDSLLNVLPSEMQTEAQSLRRDREVRQQRLMQERFSLGVGDTASAISALLRHSGLSRRTGGAGSINFPRYFSANSRGFSNTGPGARVNHKYAGRQLLDHEALACLVVLLFIDEPRLNVARLQKVFRNLCYHEETRRWLINTLIAVLRRTSGLNEDDSCPMPTTSLSTQVEATSSAMVMSRDPSRGDSCASVNNISDYLLVKGEKPMDSRKSKQPSWLRIALDSALGSRTNVFCIRRQGKLGLEYSSHISIHQYASPFICRHALDALLFLAKTFSASFMPTTTKAVASCKIADSTGTENPTEKSTSETSQGDSDFWDILLKLDAMGLGSKGKYAASTSVTQSTDSKKEEEFSDAPIGQLLVLLSHPVIGKNVQLTDKLLRLLSVVSASLPDVPAASKKPVKTNQVDGSSSTVEETTETQSGQNLVVPLPQVVTPEAARAVPLVLEPNEEHGTSATNLTIPISETESIASSLVVERSSEPGGEHPESIDSGSGDEVATNLGQTEPMVVEVNIPHETNSERIDRLPSLLSSGVSSISNPDLRLRVKPESEQTIVLENHLRLAVNVLTSGSCSEEGLEDATNLLLQISRLNLASRDSILRLLLDGARKIGEVLRASISTLFIEIVEHNKKNVQKSDPDKEEGKGKKASRIVLPEPPRRQQRTARAILGLQEPPTTAAAAGRRQAGPKPVVYELHLPSMPLLTCKKSSQALLLKVLKVILQLREAAKKSGKTSVTRDSRRAQRRAPHDLLVSHRQIESSRGLGAVVAALEAEAEAIFEVFSSMQSQRREDRDAEREVQRSQPGSSRAAGDGTAAGGQSTSDAAEASQPAEPEPVLPLLSEQLALDDLWDTLGECLTELAKTTDSHAVLVLQPAVEAFFLVHGSERTVPHASPSAGLDVSQRLSTTGLDMLPPSSPGPHSPGPLSPSRQQSVSSVSSDLPSDTQKFLRFAETHRTVLNQILRQTNVHLSDGPFAVLVDHTRVLDFDVKRRFFRQELEQADEGIRRDDLQVHLRRDQIFENSFRELHRRSPEEWKSRFYIVFEGEEGQDAGGLLREWYLIMSREMFNPNYALFTTSPGDRVTYQPNPSSHCNSNHLSYFKFVGRVVAKAIYDNKLLECFFTRSFYKHILGKPVHFTDLESFDYSFYQGLQFLLEHNISEIGMDLTFSTDVREFGLSEIRDLIPNGRNIPVTEENKRQYVKLVCQMKMTGAIRKQIDSFLEGFYEVIPKRLISIFDEQELELLISGLPNIDLDDLKANSEYHKYNENSLQIQWFWRALRSFDQADRAKFLQFVTGTSKVPLQGFAALEGMNGFQKFQIHRDDRNTDRLPSAHTCFNQLDLPAYETYDKLRLMLKKACDECPEGFGLA